MMQARAVAARQRDALAASQPPTAQPPIGQPPSSQPPSSTSSQPPGSAWHGAVQLVRAVTALQAAWRGRMARDEIFYDITYGRMW